MGCLSMFINIQCQFTWIVNFFLHFQDKLTDIKDEWRKKEGKGYCDCNECTDDATVNFPSNCPDLTSECNRFEYNIQVHLNNLDTHSTMSDPLGKWTTGNGTKMAMRTRQNMKSVQNSPGNSPVSHAKLWVGVLPFLLMYLETDYQNLRLG